MTNDVAAVIDKLLVSTTSGKTTTLVVDDTITVKSTAAGSWSFYDRSQLIINAGGSFVATNGTGYFNATIWSTPRSTVVIENGGTFTWKNYMLGIWYVDIINRGTMKTVGPYLPGCGMEMSAGAGASLILDGGKLLDPGVVRVGNLTITNNGVLYNRVAAPDFLGIKGLWIGGYAAADGQTQTNTFTLVSGVVSNHLALRIGDQGSGEGYNW